MTEDQKAKEENLKWNCILPPRNASTPAESDGYNEVEVYEAVNKMYQKCKAMWEKDAKKWREYARNT